jgi:hypothetical protein
MDVWVVALLVKKPVFILLITYIKKNAVTICPLYSFKFIVSKMMRSLNFLAALVRTPHSKFNVM